MRKIKLTLQCRVPSWNFCNYDGQTPDMRYSKDLCRFCKVTKEGKYCLLHEEYLASDNGFTYKTPECIEATAGFAITVDEPTPEPGPTIDPKMLIRETVKNYKKTVDKLISQGYPRNMAEAAAAQYLIDDGR